MTCASRTLLLIVCLVLSPIVAATSVAQPLPRVVASGLLAPGKLLVLPGGPILVAENGNGPNTGRVSMLDGDGHRATLLEGLPSGPAAPNNEPSGVSGLAFKNRTLFLSIGAGDSVIAGPVPGSEAPNPQRSSPIFSSVLAIEFDRGLTSIFGGFLVLPSDHTRLAAGESITLTNPSGQTATLRVVVDIPDHLANPRPDFPSNVRVSNPFGLETASSCELWLVDASRNQIWRVNWCDNSYAAAVSFPQLANPFPTGPRLLDPVPTSVRSYRDDLLVSFLSGAPFLPGLAEVRLVKSGSGDSEVFFRGHRMVVDVLFSERRPDGYFVLEFSQEPAAGMPGRLFYYDSQTAAPVIVTSELIGPTNMALSPFADELLITEILSGRVVAVALPR